MVKAIWKEVFDQLRPIEDLIDDRVDLVWRRSRKGLIRFQVTLYTSGVRKLTRDSKAFASVEKKEEPDGTKYELVYLRLPLGIAKESRGAPLYIDELGIKIEFKLDDPKAGIQGKTRNLEVARVQITPIVGALYSTMAANNDVDEVRQLFERWLQHLFKDLGYKTIVQVQVK